MVKCSKCNQEYDESLEQCPYCGEKNDKINPQDNFSEPDTEGNKESNKKAAIIITIVVIALVAIGVLTVVLFGTGTVKMNNDGLQIGNTSSDSQDYIPIITGTTPDGTPIVKGTAPDGTHYENSTYPNGDHVEFATTPNGELATDSNGNYIINYEASGHQNSGLINGDKGSSDNSSSKNTTSNKTSNTASDGSSTNSNGSSNNSSSNNSSPNNSSSGNGQTTSTVEKSDKVNINGQDFKVGDIVNVKVYMELPSIAFVGIDAGMKYDSSSLSYVDKSFKTPNLPGTTKNTNLDGQIKYNAINLNGYDEFMSENILCTASFKVESTNASSIEILATTEKILDDNVAAIPASKYSLRLEVEKG